MIANFLLLLLEEAEAEEIVGKSLRAWKKGGLRGVLSPSLAQSGRGRTRWICGIVGATEGGRRVMVVEMMMMMRVLLVLLVVAVADLLSWETGCRLAC